MAHTFPLRVQSGEETALGSHGRFFHHVARVHAGELRAIPSGLS